MEPDRATTPGPLQAVTLRLGVLDRARLLSQVVAAVPPAYQVAPRTLLGLTSYWSGGGALADRHCEEALRIDRACTFASQIRALQALGVPPGWVARVTE